MDVQKFGEMIVERHIHSMPHHACGLCGCYTRYYFNIDYEHKELSVEYDSSCDCSYSCSTPRIVPLSEPAEFFDKLTEDEKRMMY